MYTVLACLALGALLVLILAIGGLKNNGWGFSGDVIFGGIFGLLFAELISLFAGIFLALLLSVFAPRVDAKKEVKLVAFRDGTTMNGSFFLGCGSIENKDVYLYYSQRADGAILKGRVETDSRRPPLIYEEKRTDGVLEIHHQELDPNSKWHLWALDSVSNSYVFRVPKGTVVRQFKADLGN